MYREVVFIMLEICGCVYFSEMLPARFFSVAYVVTNFKIIIAMDGVASCLDFAVAWTCPNVVVFFACFYLQKMKFVQ
jgi:hypothetical protein